MADESRTPEPVWQALAAASNHDLDTLMGFFASDAVWDTDDAGLGRFEGAAAIRSFIEDWWGTFEEHVSEPQEVVDFGHGVVFARIREEGRLVGSEGRVDQQRGWIVLWVQQKIERGTVYLDIDEARAAAERLAAERLAEKRLHG
jgi:ketosteroid isomerase-like protein